MRLLALPRNQRVLLRQLGPQACLLLVLNAELVACRVEALFQLRMHHAC